ncbi:MAG TPA: saccharopine dehydrogenase [Nannocystis exedens]|nr:saccharopine dehydrogenase [Nannocystis exedens]
MTESTGQGREFDIVLFGATGFVGRLIAAYLAESAPSGLRWAIAGRSKEKLASLHRSLQPRSGQPAIGIVQANVDEPASLLKMAARARVVLTTVGPYVRWGMPVANACVEALTHYLDLTGEPVYVASLVRDLHARAKERGVALVPCSGFDSIPADLGVLFTVLQLPKGVPLEVRGYMRAQATVSGGTLASALEILGDRSRGNRRIVAPERSSDGRRIHSVPARLHRNRDLGIWGLPLPTVDLLIALRSAGMLERYGPDFRYGHFIGQRRLPSALGMAFAGGLFIGAAQLGPVKRLLTRMRPPGSGPSVQRRAKSWFCFRFFGEGGGERVITEVAGGDPGYDETAKMVAESAILLAADGTREGGVLTPAVALGEPLIERLGAVGLRFRRLSGALL